MPSRDAPLTPRRSMRNTGQNFIAVSGARTIANHPYTYTPRSKRMERSLIQNDLIEDEVLPAKNKKLMTYRAYERTPADTYAASSSRARPKRVKREEGRDEVERFEVGDTIVASQYSNESSVGVIAMIYVVPPGLNLEEGNDTSEDGKGKGKGGRKRSEESDDDGDEGDEEGRDDDGMDAEEKRIRVRIHWFYKFSQLPKASALHEHEPNEIYMTPDYSTVVTPFQIRQHCTISSIPPSEMPDSEDEGDDEIVATPTRKGKAKKPPPKPKTLKRKRTGNSWSYISNDPYAYYCRYVYESARGFYYKLDWDSHHKHAMKGALKSAGDAWAVMTEKLKKVLNVAKSLPTLQSTPKATPKRTNPRKKAPMEVPASPSKGRGRTKVDVESDEEVEVDEEEYEESDADSDGDDDEVESSDDSEEPSTADDIDSNNDSDDSLIRTPSRRKRGAVPSTPRKRKLTRVQPTPHSKKALQQRQKKGKRTVRPPNLFASHLALDEDDLPSDPWLRAMKVLHVGQRPDVLPCRDEEYDKILTIVEQLIEEGSGGCVYISGVPGTGKTATVHAVIRELRRRAENQEINPFEYSEINGLRVPEPAHAYTLLWEAVSGHDRVTEGLLQLEPKKALERLTNHFGKGIRLGPAGHACVVLMDEVDQLLTSKQDVVYNFFNWPTMAGSKLIVIAVANTHDLAERVMNSRVRSRLGMQRITFNPYTQPQLIEIVTSRLEFANKGFKGKNNVATIGPDAIKMASMKVASIAGDARRVLDICRRTIELAHAAKRKAEVRDVIQVVAAMQNSSTARYIAGCSLHERIMLASLLKCQKRQGIEEIKWGDVEKQHLQCRASLSNYEDSRQVPTVEELLLVLQNLLSARVMVIETGAVVARKPERERRVILNLEHSEVLRVLVDEGDAKGGTQWRRFLM